MRCDECSCQRLALFPTGVEAGMDEMDGKNIGQNCLRIHLLDTQHPKLVSWSASVLYKERRKAPNFGVMIIS